MNETPAPARADVPVTGDVVGEHPCPACRRSVVQVFRPGRGRIYCDNRCRQRAYRWRRARGIRLCVERTGPTEILHNDRNHARRDPRDPAVTVRDRRARELTVCGVFARPLRDLRRTHRQFVPEFDNSCERCRDLVGAGPDGSGIPDVVRAYLPDPVKTAEWAEQRARASVSRQRRRAG